MRINVVLSLLKKEFLNIIRDRKSFIIMILLPLLMFPVMVGLMSIVLTGATKIDSTIKLGVNYKIDEKFNEYLKSSSDKYNIEIIYDSADHLKEMFNNDKIEIFVINEGNDYEIHYDENKTTNVANAKKIEDLYYKYKEIIISDTLKEKGISYEAIKDSFNIKFVQESVTEMGSFVPSIISMVLVMIISSVCFSVAIDVVISEKEKGTLETLLSLPVKKTELITSKFLTVFTLSCMSGLLTYISLFCTLFFANKTLSMLGVISIKISFTTLFIFLISIILISLLFSGLLLSTTIFSKNLKEAQNSLYPLELFITFISMLPIFGVKSTLKLALIPFVNISLLFNNALSMVINPWFVVLTFASSIIYSVLLIIIISKLYNEEDILFNTKALNYIKFSNGKQKTVVLSIPLVLFISFIIYVLAIYFTLLFVSAPKYLLLAMMPITIFLVITITFFIVHFDIKSLNLKGFKIRNFINTLCLFLGTCIISNFIVNFLCKLFPGIVKDFSVFSKYLTFDNLALSIIVIALLPAICEELLFRGLIFPAFKKRYNLIVALIASAFIFGVYHMNIVQGINAFIVGLALAYSYYKTGSLFVPMLFHFANNLISTLISHFEALSFELSRGYSVFFVICGLILVIISIYNCETKLKS